MSQSMQWLAIAITLVLLVAAVVTLFKLFNSPTGERYIRQQTQGPFVPVAESSDSATQAQQESRSAVRSKGEP